MLQQLPLTQLIPSTQFFSSHPLHFFFFFNDTATTEIYTLSLHDALPIWVFAKRTAGIRTDASLLVIKEQAFVGFFTTYVATLKFFELLMKLVFEFASGSFF